MCLASRLPVTAHAAWAALGHSGLRARGCCGARLARQEHPCVAASMAETILHLGAGSIGGACGIAAGHPFDTCVPWSSATCAWHRNGRGRVVRTSAVPHASAPTWRSCCGTRGIPSGGREHAAISCLLWGPALRMWASPGATCLESLLRVPSAVQLDATAPLVLPDTVAPLAHRVKVKLQTQASGAQAKYRGPLHCAISIARAEGLRGFFRGPCSSQHTPHTRSSACAVRASHPCRRRRPIVQASRAPSWPMPPSTPFSLPSSTVPCASSKLGAMQPGGVRVSSSSQPARHPAYRRHPLPALPSV